MLFRLLLLLMQDSPYCATGTATVTQTGTAGGTYTAPAGVVINAATGDIDLVASTPGTYTITYSFTSGACSNTTTTNILSMLYQLLRSLMLDSPYCATGTATVTQTGTAGGTYTAPAGVVINAATGDIDLVASTPGTYTITYTSPVEHVVIQQLLNHYQCFTNCYDRLYRISILRNRHRYCNADRNSRWNIYCTCRCCDQCCNRRY